MKVLLRVGYIIGGLNISETQIYDTKLLRSTRFIKSADLSSLVGLVHWLAPKGGFKMSNQEKVCRQFYGIGLLGVLRELGVALKLRVQSCYN